MARRVIGYLAVLGVMSMMTGCSSLGRVPTLTSTGSMHSDPMKVVSRPTEFGLETTGRSEGEAYYKKFLWFTIEGDKPNTVAPVVGRRVKDPLEMLACHRAIERVDGSDALYILTTECKKFNVLGFLYREKTIKVKGKTLKLNDLGPMDAERADKYRTPSTPVEVFIKK